MADKPVKIPRWNDDLTNNTEPAEAKKDEGWTANEKPIPSSFFNWLQNLYGEWIKWIDERFFNTLGGFGAVASPGVGIKKLVVDATGISPFAQAAIHAIGGDDVAAVHGVSAQGGSNGGAGVIGQSLAGGTQDGVRGISESAGGSGVFGQGQNTNPGVTGSSQSGYGVVASADPTTPAKAALRLVPQDANPTSPLEGDVYVNSVLKVVRFYNGTSWLTLSTSTIFGNDYQSAVSLARSTTTSATFQTKATLTTPALTGTYRIGWKAAIDNTGTPAANLGEFRLQNTTDATTVGTTRVYQAKASACRDLTGGLAEVVFAGVAKTFEIQFRDQAGGNTQGIEDARIEIWRVM